MLNDLSSPLSLLRTRRSGRPVEMTGPGPTADELDAILTIAARTPDHGKLSPWRFVTVGADQREALSHLLLQALAESNPEATVAHREKEIGFAHYAGQLVVLVSSPIAGHKIPLWEQQLSCGAAGMNLLLAAHALGFVGGWLTGWRSYAERVRDSFCKPGEQIAGFIFIGHPAREIEERPRPPLDSVVSRWSPPTG